MSAVAIAPTASLGAGEGAYEQGRQWERVRYGIDCASALAEELAALGVERPFLLTTGSIERAGLAERVRDSLGSSLAGEFGRCRAHVPEEVVVAAADAVAAAGADGLVAIGGSSVIDCAKAVSLVLAEAPGGDRPLESLRAAGIGSDPTLPIVALPTTLSGGEFTGVVATTDHDGVKWLLRDPRLAPRTVLLDPRLTVETPTALWRATGVKTLSDAIEQIAIGASPVVDALAERAIELFVGSLAAGPDDLEARLRCQQAAWMALFGLHDAGSAVGLGGALRHQVAVTFGVPHGEVTCVLLPHVVRFNAGAVPARSAAVARALGLDDEGDGEATWAKVAERLEAFVAELGLPGRMSEIVGAEADLPALAERVLDEAAARSNPRAVRSSEEVVELLEAAW
jgi:alcohol dehydrogenase class IV